MIYVASTYSHPDEGVRALRHQQVMTFVAQCLAKKLWVYSPILHCHTLALMHDLPFEAAHWAEYNDHMLQTASEVFMLCLPGWRRSVGCRTELIRAEELGRRITYFGPTGRLIEAVEAGE